MHIAIAGSTGLIGSKLTALARAEGHEVIELSRSKGYDLLVADDRLEQALQGAEAVVDVTQGPIQNPEATEFFTTVARNLGRAATTAGVSRTVVLSIVGIDDPHGNGYYEAKLAQERATRDSAPGVVVLRATQFHDFPGQMLEWNRDGDVTRIIDVPNQPVDTHEIVKLLLALATGQAEGDTDLAGPKVERLIDQVQTLIDRSGESITIERIEVPEAAGQAMLPGPDALIRGPEWKDWLEAQS